MTDSRTEPSVQGLVRYFTQKYQDLAQQRRVEQHNPMLYKQLKAEAAEFNREIAQSEEAIQPDE